MRSGIIAAVFVAIGALAGVDAIGDLYQGIAPWNVSLDLALTAGALLAGGYFFWQYRRVAQQMKKLVLAVDAARDDAEHWRIRSAQVLPALGAAILRQFDRWGLTAEEQELALLVLNGVSLEEIAARRRSDVDTVRADMEATYRKAGVSDVCALAAFFVRDMLIVAGHGRR